MKTHRIYPQTQLISHQNKPIRQGDDGSLVTTLGAVIEYVLVSVHPGEEVPYAKKLARFELAERVFKATNPVIGVAGEEPCIELSLEEMAMIKKQVDKFYGPVVCGAFERAIEPRPSLDEEKESEETGA